MGLLRLNRGSAPSRREDAHCRGFAVTGIGGGVGRRCRDQSGKPACSQSTTTGVSPVSTLVPRLACTSLALLLALPAAAVTLTVGASGCQFGSIQQAIERAATTPEADVIRVANNASYGFQALKKLDAYPLALVGGYPDCQPAPVPNGQTTLDGNGMGGFGAVHRRRRSGCVQLRDPAAARRSGCSGAVAACMLMRRRDASPSPMSASPAMPPIRAAASPSTAPQVMP